MHPSGPFLLSSSASASCSSSSAASASASSAASRVPALLSSDAGVAPHSFPSLMRHFSSVYMTSFECSGCHVNLWHVIKPERAYYLGRESASKYPVRNGKLSHVTI